MSGWGDLGAALGGDSELAYQKGLALGANTQNALTEARARVEKAKAQEGLSSSLQANGMPKTQADAISTTLQAGGGFGDVTNDQLKSQELGFRMTAGNPGTSPEAANVAMRALASGPTPQSHAVGAHSYENLYEPGVKPLGDAMNSGGTSAGMQALQAFHMIGPDGKVVPGMEAKAFDVFRNTQRIVDEGGVPAAVYNNPFAASPHAPSAPVAAPAGLGSAIAPPSAPPQAAPVVPQAQPVSTVDRVASNAAAIGGAKKFADVQAEKAAALPSTLLKLDDFERNVDTLLAKPGFDTIYGHLSGTDTGQAISTFLSQDAADAQAALGQIDAQSFGISIQTMRGLGQLSNQEGLKVQKAFALATNPRLAPNEARLAYDSLKTHLAELRRVAQIEAGQSPANGAAPVPAAGATPTFATEAEAAAAGLAPGTRVTIGGIPGTWQ